MYQEVNLCPNLTVAENIFLGREQVSGPVVRSRRMRRRAAELVAGVRPEHRRLRPLGSFPLAIQQLVAIVRAVDLNRAGGAGTKALILDEPTSSLDRDEVDILFGVMRQLRDAGVAILFVSHFLDQIYEICDRMTVLRNGKLRRRAHGDGPRPGRAGSTHARPRTAGTGEARRARPRGHRKERVLQAHGLGRKRSIAPFDLEIGAGEVVGLAGLLGSGRTELARLLFGADQADSGTLEIGGEPASLRRGPQAAIARGIAFCPENRKAEGLIPDLTVRENIILAMQAARGWAPADPAGARGRTRRQVHRSARHPAGRPRGQGRLDCPAATSRRCCWPAG